jgi:hypothetical protein
VEKKIEREKILHLLCEKIQKGKTFLLHLSLREKKRKEFSFASLFEGKERTYRTVSSVENKKERKSSKLPLPSSSRRKELNFVNKRNLPSSHHCKE